MCWRMALSNTGSWCCGHRREAAAEDAPELAQRREDAPLLLVDHAEHLVLHLHGAEADAVLLAPAHDLPGAEADVEVVGLEEVRVLAVAPDAQGREALAELLLAVVEQVRLARGVRLELRLQQHGLVRVQRLALRLGALLPPAREHGLGLHEGVEMAGVVEHLRAPVEERA